jgi:hypothetical protein
MAAEFEPDPEARRRAENLSARLMRDLRKVTERGPRSDFRRQVFREAHYREEAAGAPIQDVVDDVAEMANEFAVSRRIDGEILCARIGDGELAPVSLRDSLHGAPWPFGSTQWWDVWEEFPFPFPRGVWRDAIKRAARDGDEELVSTSVEEAEAMTERNLASFLSFRFAGLKLLPDWLHWNRDAGSGGGRPGPPRSDSTSNPPPPVTGTGGGLQVEVTSQTPGLRLHIAPSYFQTWIFFGSPASPVSNFVLPGRYRFAGDGPMQRRRISDPAVFSIPPTYKPVVTRF